jgi:hypothetical protein
MYLKRSDVLGHSWLHSSGTKKMCSQHLVVFVQCLGVVPQVVRKAVVLANLSKALTAEKGVVLQLLVANLAGIRAGIRTELALQGLHDPLCLRVALIFLRALKQLSGFLLMTRCFCGTSGKLKLFVLIMMSPTRSFDLAS